VAQSNGGRARAVTASQPPALEFDFSSPEKIPASLGLVATMMLQRRIDAKATHAICHAADTALRAYALSTVKSQLDRVERLLESIRKRPVDPAETTDLLRFERSKLQETDEMLEELGRRNDKVTDDD
jgi:hypothetical protein